MSAPKLYLGGKPIGRAYDAVRRARHFLLAVRPPAPDHDEAFRIHLDLIDAEVMLEQMLDSMTVEVELCAEQS